MNKIPFDISFKERIERGKVKVVTRDNREVTIIKWDLKGNYPIVACVKVEVCNYEGDESWFEERPYAFSKEGKRYKGFPEDKSDIFILVEEPVSEDLEEAAFDYAEACKYEGGEKLLCIEHFKAGAKRQKEQLMEDAIDATVESDPDSHGADYGLQKLHIDYGQLEAKGIKPGTKVKVIIIKED